MRRIRLVRPQHPGRLGLTAFALAAALVTSVAATAAAAPVRPTATAATTSANLVVDAGAESVAQCSPAGLDGMTIPGWTINSGLPNIVCYGTSGWPTSSSPGSPTRGTAFFAGGGTGNSDISQNVDVSAAASAIDAGGVPYNLGGWLGGYASQNDRVALIATFQNGSGATLGSTTLGPVTNSDRGNTTGMIDKTGSGTLPAGTRSVKIELAFTWTAGNTTDGYADDISFTIGANIPAPSLTAPASAVPGFDHVFLVYMENEDYSGIIGNSSAPYINSLIPKATVLKQSYATTHPSDPNYIALAGGGLYGVTGNTVSTSTINAPHVGNSVDNAGKTWKSYVENENGNCDYSSHGYYSPDDVPFAFFQNFKADKSATGYCAQHDQPLTQMTTDLASAATTPNFVWFEPDDCDDMESCGVAAGDTWLSNTLPTIFTSPAWTTQKSLLILTWDEGAVKSYGPGYPNQVPTLLIGSQGTVKTDYYSSQRTDQYGLLRTVDQALGLAPLTNNDAYAATVNDAWGTGSGGGGGPIVSGGVYNVVLQGGQVMDDPGSSTSTGTQMIVYALNSPASDNQKWTFTANGDGSYTVKNNASGLCLDDSGASGNAGSPIIQWTCSGAVNQNWSVVAHGSSYELVSKQSGLPVTAAGTANLSKLTQQADTGSSLQMWTFTKVG